jgi:hypothetical protein
MATTYDATLDSEEEIDVFPEHKYEPRREYLLAAILTVDSVCDCARLNWAVMGGIALFLLGSERTTVDVDILIEADSREFFEPSRPNRGK